MKLIHTLTLATALVSTSALAGGGVHHGGFDAERLARKLDLSEQQTIQVKAIVEAHADELQALHKQIRELRQELRSPDQASFDEAKVRRQSEELGDLMGEAAFLKSRAQSQVHAVLTPEQRQELAAKRERFEERRRHHDRD